MKRIRYALVLLGGIIAFCCCNKDNDEEDRFQLLTSHVWLADSLMADGVDASGPGMPLESFKGEAEFRKDGTGSFGEFTGSWRFQMGQTEIVITTNAHPIPITASIVELTSSSLKITTGFPGQATGELMDIRMTFKPK